MKPNTKFELSVRDIDLIETALRSIEQTKEVQQLLGKIHHQKVWYRPKEGYVGGQCCSMNTFNTILYYFLALAARYAINKTVKGQASTCPLLYENTHYKTRRKI